MEHSEGSLTRKSSARSSVIVLKKRNEIESSSNRISILFVGSYGAGKTSLITRLGTDKFTPSFRATIGIDFFMIGATVDGKDYMVQLVDTAGQERFETMGPGFYNKTNGVMIVYDITNYTSYESIKFWLYEVQRFVKRNDGTHYPIILLGNKTDVDVNHIDGQKVAEDLDMDGFFKTSAKNGEGIDDAMKLMIDLIISNNYNIHDQDMIEVSDGLQPESRKCC